MEIDQLKANVIVTGSIFSEPVQVLVVTPRGSSVKLVGRGLKTNQVHELILNAGQIAQLQATPDKEPFDGESLHFRLGVEALRLGLAYEYDPFFALAIARVDPLPHQLEAVYNYFLKQPRIRFLLADDPGRIIIALYIQLAKAFKEMLYTVMPNSSLSSQLIFCHANFFVVMLNEVKHLIKHRNL